jgi:radical SAM protein with 4Fe4S-binding SPASM domain
MQDVGIAAVSLSIDGADAATHDELRGRPGAFERARAAAAALRAAGLPFQVNTTVHRGNADRLAGIDRLVADLGAATWDLFFLVPTGRGRDLAAAALAPDAYEAALRWAAVRARDGSPTLKVTCAPRYVPLAAEVGVEGRGCLGGRSFAFVGADGAVQMCGFLPEAAGNVRERSFSATWADSPLFAELRDPATLTGACGACVHRATCGGCRARAAAAGDRRGADPCCGIAAGWEAHRGS